MAGPEVKLTFVGDASKLTAAMDKVGGGAKEMAGDLDAASSDAKGFGKAMDRAAEATDASEGKFMGAADLLDGLGGAFGLPTEGATNLMRSFGDLSGGFTAIGPLFTSVLTKLGLMTGATAAQATATTGAATAQTGLNLAMLANPIGIVIAIIVALVGIFILLWTKVEGFRNVIIGVWEWMQKWIPQFKLLGAAVEWVTGLFGSSSDKVKEHQERMEEHAKKIDEVLYTLNNGTVVSREAWTQWSDDVQQSVEDILNPLDRAREQSTLTFDQLKSNLEDNQKFFEGWANNLAILADRGFTALAFEMQQLGPEAETAVGQMINMSDSKLAEMEALFAERGKTIGGSGVSQIADALAGADWSGLGRYIAIAIGVDLDQKLNAIMEETLTNLREQGATIGVTFGTTVSRATPGVRQHGGPVFPGRPYIVGEHRPELFIPGQVGYVAPRVPMGGTTVINISPVIQAGVVTPNLGEEIAALLKREIDRGGPLGLS